MADDLDMTGSEVRAQAQILEAFRGVATLMDTDLKLSPDPRLPKRRKDEHKRDEDSTSRDSAHLHQMLLTMARLILRHEQEIQGLHRVDTFMIFCNREPSGLLQLLIQETGQWKKQLEKPALVRMPLRQHLFQAMLRHLLNQITRISKCSKEDDLMKALLKEGAILEDYSWPYLEWSKDQQRLVKNAKRPVTMPKMMEHVGELLEMATDSQLVQKFHSMNPQTAADIVPWRLTLNLRSDPPWELLFQLAYNSIWALLGATLKPHSQMQSGLARNLQEMVNTKTPKGKGKGHKGSKGGK